MCCDSCGTMPTCKFSLLCEDYSLADGVTYTCSFCCWRRKNQFNGELRPLTPPPMTSSSDEGLSRSQRMIKKMLIVR